MKGDLYDFLHALGERESGSKYEVKNKLGFMGRWQFGKPRLYDLGLSVDGWHPKDRPVLKVISWEELKNDSLRQCMLVVKHIRLLKNHYKDNPNIGKEVLGIKVTLSGLVAGAHLKGTGGVAEFLKGKNNADAFGTEITEYISKFGDYNLAE